MKKEEFIQSLYQSVIKENGTIYQDLFANTDINAVKDSYWKEALMFYSELNDEGKELLFKLIEQVQVDTVSNVLVY
jgi:putative transposase